MAQNWYGAGELWKKDVKSVRAGAETRKEFYGDKALRKVGSKLLGDVSGFSTDDLVTKLKEHAEITKDEKILAGKWDPEKVGPKRYISDILKDFFEQKCGSKRGTADALIALKFLNAEIENVDLIREGETVEIENGILTVKKGSEVVARGAILGRDKLHAGSPEALGRSGAVRKKTRAALAAIKAEVAPATAARPTGTPIVPEPLGPAAVMPPAPPAAPPAVPAVTATQPGPPAGPVAVLPPAPLAAAPATPPPRPPAALPPGPVAAPPPAPSAAARPAAPAAPRPAPTAAPLPSLPPAAPRPAPTGPSTAPPAGPVALATPTIAPPGAPPAAAAEKSPEEILADREKEVGQLKVKGYTIEKSKTPDSLGFYSAIFEVRAEGKKEVVATIGVVKDSPENVHVHIKRPVFEKSGTQEDENAGNFPDLTELAEKLPKLINPPETEQKEKIAKRKNEIEQALKAQKDLKILAHEIKLVEDKGTKKELAYFKMQLAGVTGPAVDVGFVGIYKENPTYLVLEKLDHGRVGVFQPANELANAAANSTNFTWGGGTMIPGAVPPEALPGAPAVAPRRKPAEALKEIQTNIKKIKIANHTIRQTYLFGGAKIDKDTIAYEVKDNRTGKIVAVFDFQKANPDSIELFFTKSANDFEPGISRLGVAELARRLNDRLNPPATPAAPPPSATIDPFAELDARVAAAPKKTENDPAVLTDLIDNLAHDKKWDDVLLIAYAIITNPKSNADQKANAELKSIDAFKAQNKVDSAIQAYEEYTRYKSTDYPKRMEGIRYAFENKKFEDARRMAEIMFPEIKAIPHELGVQLTEVYGDIAFELKHFDAARQNWTLVLATYQPASADWLRVKAKLDKLPAGK